MFLAFAKLYIRDILDLKESHQVPGMLPILLAFPCVNVCILHSPKAAEI